MGRMSRPGGTKMANEPEGQSFIRPIDFNQLLKRLKLGLTDAAQTCGVTSQQLGNWANRGYIQCGRNSRDRTYDYSALEKVCLIKQGLNKGLSLREAVKAAESSITRHAQKRKALKALTDEDLKSLVLARASRLRQLVNHIRRGLRTHQALTDYAILRKVASIELRELITFLESNPYLAHAAGHLEKRLCRPADEIQKELDLLVGCRFLQKLCYPGGDIYRYIPPRQP